MSVDYAANYGIGYQVVEGDGIAGHETILQDGLSEYLEQFLGDRFQYFEVGYGKYSGEENDVFICAKYPFEYGLDLSRTKAEIDRELNRIGLDVVGEFGLIGGILMY